MRFYRSTRFFKILLPNCVWRIPLSKKLYLTFDDGPTPEVTPWVLDTLAEHGVKATFFCVGDNVERYPELYQRVLDEGHCVGNHTYSHISAWEHGFTTWFQDFEKAEKLIKSKLIRPPYGKISPWHVYKLRRRGYEVVMWSFITYDFDPSSDPAVAMKKMRRLRNGHIVVMHDQPKAKEHLKTILPGILKEHANKSFGILKPS